MFIKVNTIPPTTYASLRGGGLLVGIVKILKTIKE